LVSFITLFFFCEFLDGPGDVDIRLLQLSPETELAFETFRIETQSWTFALLSTDDVFIEAGIVYAIEIRLTNREVRYDIINGSPPPLVSQVTWLEGYSCTQSGSFCATDLPSETTRLYSVDFGFFPGESLLKLHLIELLKVDFDRLSFFFHHPLIVAPNEN
jgi:hypothetical protein